MKRSVCVSLAIVNQINVAIDTVSMQFVSKSFSSIESVQSQFLAAFSSAIMGVQAISVADFRLQQLSVEGDVLTGDIIAQVLIDPLDAMRALSTLVQNNELTFEFAGEKYTPMFTQACH